MKGIDLHRKFSLRPLQINEVSFSCLVLLLIPISITCVCDYMTTINWIFHFCYLLWLWWEEWLCWDIKERIGYIQLHCLALCYNGGVRRSNCLKPLALARYHNNNEFLTTGSFLTIGCPGKECQAEYHQPGQEMSKGERRLQSLCPTNFPESSSLESILAEWWTRLRKDPELKWLATYNPETNPITIKSNPVSHMAEQLSWTPLPSYSPTQAPLPNKVSCFVQHVRLLKTLHFPVVEKSPLLGPRRVLLLARWDITQYNNVCKGQWHQK